MKSAISFLLILLGLPAWTVYAETKGSPLESITSEDDWFDGSMDTKEVCCRGEINGRKVFVYICNTTTNDIVVNRTANDFSYAVKYRNAKNESRVFERVCMTECHMGWIEVLHGQDRLRCDGMYSTNFRFELPKDCVRVECVAVELEMIHFPEIGKCRTAVELRGHFLRNTFRKIVDFEKVNESDKQGGEQKNRRKTRRVTAEERH